MVLDGQVWLITGASGMGAATARLAAIYGAKVFVCGLEEADCRQLAAECCGGFHCGDLSDTAEAEKAVARCISELGPIDALFNVAGMSGRKFGDGPLHLVTDNGWERTFDMNLKTMFHVSRTVLRRMLPRGQGAILNMTSVAAYAPEPHHFDTHAYAAAKGAVISLTKSMAAYYAPHGIRVNAIAPGSVRSPMSLRAQTDERILQMLKTKQPLSGTFIEPEEVARAAVFLLGPGSQMITGQVLGIDAGWAVS
ncbi:SDR family NAD(P)-dependent oxidoreductase [Paludibaculum fermentans]|uniref:SDR family oxidoreductase n=1 Tax=Paludibaculum fermentans TaxID=1473598 RepID=A0A7S7NTE3_PALFE|nr:SDR family oxidoreductase [Paludibaculum fermentans]QOY89492.1 SDR family oxidoreductase [Paludibaculum fermentans]